MQDAILTDMGYEEISLSDALKCFTLDQVQEWLKNSVDQGEAGWDYEGLVKYMAWDIPSSDEEKIDEIIYESEDFDWTPNQVCVGVAKAVYADHKWVRVLELTNGDDHSFVKRCEMGAIQLGAELRTSLGVSVVVINDCKEAIKTLESTIENIRWMSRGNTSKAHDLRICDASKILYGGDRQ